MLKSLPYYYEIWKCLLHSCHFILKMKLHFISFHLAPMGRTKRHLHFSLGLPSCLGYFVIDHILCIEPHVKAIRFIAKSYKTN